MKTLLCMTLTMIALNASAKSDLSEEARFRIEARIAQIIQEETKQPCKQETMKFDGNSYRVATGGVSIGLSSVVGSFKTKCGNVLIKSKVVGANESDMRSIKIDFDSRDELYTEE